MRRDMFKVIVERPRYLPPSNPKRSRPPRDQEDAPRCEGMRRPHVHGGCPKNLNDYLTPLRRFLSKQVGRPWNKVYSEICEHLRVDSTGQEHLRRHVRDFVSIHVKRGPDGRMWDRSGHRGACLFYVDPRTGILRVNKPKRR